MAFVPGACDGTVDGSGLREGAQRLQDRNPAELTVEQTLQLLHAPQEQPAPLLQERVAIAERATHGIGIEQLVLQLGAALEAGLERDSTLAATAYDRVTLASASSAAAKAAQAAEAAERGDATTAATAVSGAATGDEGVLSPAEQSQSVAAVLRSSLGAARNACMLASKGGPASPDTGHGAGAATSAGIVGPALQGGHAEMVSAGENQHRQAIAAHENHPMAAPRVSAQLQPNGGGATPDPSDGMIAPGVAAPLLQGDAGLAPSSPGHALLPSSGGAPVHLSGHGQELTLSNCAVVPGMAGLLQNGSLGGNRLSYNGGVFDGHAAPPASGNGAAVSGMAGLLPLLQVPRGTQGLQF